MPVSITFNTAQTAAKIRAASERAVAVVAQTVLDDINEYVPDDQDGLIDSSAIHSDIEHGELVWATPYVRYLYHGVLMVDPLTGSPWAREGQTKVLASPKVQLKFDKQKNPKAGSHWCERAYADKHDEWQEKYQAAFNREMRK